MTAHDELDPAELDAAAKAYTFTHVGGCWFIERSADSSGITLTDDLPDAEAFTHELCDRLNGLAAAADRAPQPGRRVRADHSD